MHVLTIWLLYRIVPKLNLEQTYIFGKCILHIKNTIYFIVKFWCTALDKKMGGWLVMDRVTGLGHFCKFWQQIFLQNYPKIFRYLSAILKNISVNGKTAVATFGGHFCKILATFYPNIWSHWMLVHATAFWCNFWGALSDLLEWCILLGDGKKIVEQLKNLNELAARELGHEMHWAFVGCIFASVFGTIRWGPFAQAVVRQMNDLVRSQVGS